MNPSFLPKGNTLARKLAFGRCHSHQIEIRRPFRASVSTSTTVNAPTFWVALSLPRYLRLAHGLATESLVSGQWSLVSSHRLRVIREVADISTLLRTLPSYSVLGVEADSKGNHPGHLVPPVFTLHFSYARQGVPTLILTVTRGYHLPMLPSSRFFA